MAEPLLESIENETNSVDVLHCIAWENCHHKEDERTVGDWMDSCDCTHTALSMVILRMMLLKR